MPYVLDHKTDFATINNMWLGSLELNSRAFGKWLRENQNGAHQLVIEFLGNV